MMKKKLLQTLLPATILCLILTCCLNGSFSEVVTGEPKSSSSLNYETDYTFDIYRGHFRSAYTLHMSVPTSLYSYYERKSHFLSSDGDYSRFATPNAFKVVAENIENITNEVQYSDEQFANAVLTLVRQIPYVKSATKYPVEAIVENSGDCDVLSLLAASIMKAGGLDVVLLHYQSTNPSHMNIGVYLPYTPVYRSLWSSPACFEYRNKTYWMAECTPRGDWKVGDRPELLADAKPRVISLGGAEKDSPGQVSSSINDPLASSSISVTVSSDNSSLEGDERSLSITGEVSPALADKNVTMYVGRDGLAADRAMLVLWYISVRHNTPSLKDLGLILP